MLKLYKYALLLLLLSLLQVSSAPPPRPKLLTATVAERHGPTALERVDGTGLGTGGMRGNNRIVDTDIAATLKLGIKDTTGSGSVSDPNILELATVKELTKMEPRLSLLEKLMEDLGATFYLEQTRDLTMFMPTNKAFERSTVDVFTLPWAARWQIFQNLIIPQNVIKLSDLSSGQHKYTSWQGSSVALNVGAMRGLANSKKITVNGSECSVLEKHGGIETFNGICYMIDCFIMPDNVDEILDMGGGGEIVIENHVDNQETSTTIYAINKGRGRHNNSADHSSNNEDASVVINDNSGAEKSSKPIISASSSIVLGRDDFVAPDFVRHINIAHEQWNKTVKERKQNMLEIDQNHIHNTANESNYNSNADLSGSGSSSNIIPPVEGVTFPSFQESTGNSGAVGVLDSTGIASVAPAERKDDIGDINSSTRIKALAIGDGGFSLFGNDDAYYTDSSSPTAYSYEAPDSSISLASYPTSPPASSTPAPPPSSPVPSKFGWAAASLGWTEHQPGKVLQEAPKGSLAEDSSQGIAAYRKSKANRKKTTSADNANGLSRWRRRRNSRLARLFSLSNQGITFSAISQPDTYAPIFQRSPQLAASALPISKTSSPPLWLPATPATTEDEASTPLSVASTEASRSTGNDLVNVDSSRLSDLGFDASVKYSSGSNGIIPVTAANIHVSGNDDAEVSALGLEGGAAVVDLDAGYDGSHYSNDELTAWENSGTERVRYVSGNNSVSSSDDFDDGSSSGGFAESYEKVFGDNGLVNLYWKDEQNINDSIYNNNYYNSYDGVAYYPVSTNTDTTELSAIPSLVGSNGAGLNTTSSDKYSMEGTGVLGRRSSPLSPPDDYQVLYYPLVDTRPEDGSSAAPFFDKTPFPSPRALPVPATVEVDESYADTDVISILGKVPELSVLHEMMSSTVGAGGSMARRVYMTMFAPLNSAIELPSTICSSYEDDGFNYKKIMEEIGSNHITMGKRVDPSKLTPGKLITADNKGRRNKIFVYKDVYGDIIINHSAKTLKVYKAKNGFLYLIDRVLMPPYNEGPNLSEYIKQDTRLSLLRSIMGSEGVMGKYTHLGPITVFLVTDEGYSGIDRGDGSEEGIQLCVLDAFNRPENAIYGQQLMGHMVLPGKVRIEDMLDGSAWPPLYGEPLTVKKIYNEYEATYTTFIDNKAQIIQANIPIYNGYVHIIDSVLIPSSMSIKQISYWSCLDSHLRRNRMQVRAALARVDQYKPLPVLGIPPSARPSWVGYGLNRYFPPPSGSYDEFKTAFQRSIRGEREKVLSGRANGIGAGGLGNGIGNGNRRGVGNLKEYSNTVYYSLG